MRVIGATSVMARRAVRFRSPFLAVSSTSVTMRAEITTRELNTFRACSQLGRSLLSRMFLVPFHIYPSIDAVDSCVVVLA